MWDIRSEHTMQLTVSGIMLEKLLQTYSLLLRQDDYVAEREDVPDVVINNTLGPDIVLDICDSATTMKLMTIQGLESKAVPRAPIDYVGGPTLTPGSTSTAAAGTGSASGSTGPHPPLTARKACDVHSVVDIHFAGQFGEERLPLLHLPFNITRPRTYNLLPRPLPEEPQPETHHGDHDNDDATITTSMSYTTARTTGGAPLSALCNLPSQTSTASALSPSAAGGGAGGGTPSGLSAGSILGMIKQSPIASITQLPTALPPAPVTGRDLVKSMVVQGSSTGANTTSNTTTTTSASSNSNQKSTPSMMTTMATARSRSVLLEPIVEEVFEYSRYDPITGKWRKPFLPGDPPEWTDASGTVKRDIQSITLKQSGQWEWLDKWSIDTDTGNVLGEEVDKEGWEYGTVFSNFSIASRRRSHHAMDCVRRRRWTRTRIPTAASIDERFRPLSVFWDVKALSNGTRRVDLRSGLQVTNLMPFAVLISLSYSGWAEDATFGPIEEAATFNVPLAQVITAPIKALVKPPITIRITMHLYFTTSPSSLTLSLSITLSIIPKD